MYFGAGICTTGVLCAAMRNNLFALNNPWLLFFGSFGLLIGTQFTSYYQKPVLKHLLWGGFMASMGLSLVPLI
jgi:hypothetical protein